MLLQSTVAGIYGAGGAIGGVVARAFAREGARVSLAGRTRPSSTKSPTISARTGASRTPPPSTPSTSGPCTITSTRWWSSPGTSTSLSTSYNMETSSSR